MNTTAINRRMLIGVFNALSKADTAWAIKTLAEKLYDNEVVPEGRSNSIIMPSAYSKSLPKEVLDMTLKHRKKVSYGSYGEYKADLVSAIEDKFR